MGIKFLCTQCGKKLNVKAFLAGKRGICPHCGARIDIPDEAEEKTIVTVPIAGAVASGTTPGAAPLALPAASSHSGAAGRSHPGGSLPTPAAPFSPAGGRPSHVPTAMPVAATAPGASAAASGVPVSGIPAQPAAGSAMSDPILEAPTAVWYVRPPTGGQFGPAPGETLRKWIGEGRVTADSLVWREGWGDWKPASGVFPQLGAAPPPPTGGGALITPSKPSTLTARGGGGSNTMAMTLVIVLAILIIPLLGLLVYVLMNMPGR